MLKRTVFIQSQFKRRLRADERGVTSVIGAVLVLSLIIIAMSVYLGQVVPPYQRKNEADHMNTIREVFFELQSAIFARKNTTIDLPMAPEPTQIFSLPPNSSRVTITPARAVKRFQPLADTYVDNNQPGANFGNSEELWVRSYRDPATGTARNSRIYIKFGLTSQLPGVDAGDIVEAWLVLYCENITKFTGAPWGNPAIPITNPGSLPDLPILAEVRTVQSGAWSEGSVTWNNQGALGVGDPIEAMDWPNEDNYGVKENEAWSTFDVTSWVRDQLRAGQENASFMVKAVYENSALYRAARFSSKERGALPTGETGHPPYLKPHLTVIYENGNSPGAPVYDNWGAFIEGGTIKLDTDYLEFPSHSFTLESGALIQQQWGYAYDLMISDPGLVVGERIEDDNAIAVYVNRYRVVNRDRLTSTADVKFIVKVWENTDYRIAPTDTNGDGKLDPNRENVLITVHTDFEWEWKRYFRDLTVKWNDSASKGGLEWWVGNEWSDEVTEFMAKLYVPRNVRLYVWGRIDQPGAKDIYYYDRTYDMEVEVGI